MSKLKISAAIICMNEETNIARCIESLAWADEVVVLDSGSEDKTLEIARSLGAKCFSEKWRGFCDQKNRLSELCENDWVFNLDADEACTTELANEVQRILSEENDETCAYEFPRKSFHLGRWISHGGWYPDFQRRLYNKKHSRWQGGALHEKVEAAKVKRVNAPILHWVFKDLSDQVAANNRYSSLGAEKYIEEGKSFSWVLFLTKPISKFLETYLFKLGFLDGVAGFVISVGAAYSIFLKFAKIYYLQKSKDQKTIE
ncbi:MAG: glycosyltransferase family 2 protein [Bdellovibrionota bacterium]|nr:glycosyltransferase family 2 protein [Bdellovibrionota bacterium]